MRLRAAEQNLQRLEDVIGQLASQIDVAQAPGPPGDPLSQRVGAGPRSRSHAVPPALDWRPAPKLAAAEQAKTQAVRIGRRSHRRRKPKPAASGNRPRPNCRRCARPKPRPAAGLQRLVVARETLDREEDPRAASASPNSIAGWSQFERRHRARAPACCPMPRPRWPGSAAEEEVLRRDIETDASKRAGADQRVAEADARAGRGRKDLRRTDRHARRPHRTAQSARRSSARARRTARPARQAKSPTSTPSWRGSNAASDGHPDLAHCSQATSKQAQQRGRPKREAAALRAEAAHSAARQALDVARAPLAEAERRAGRLETEAQDAGQAAACRHQEPVAVGDRQPHGREGLRGRARRRARRRSRSAGRSDARRCAGPAPIVDPSDPASAGRRRAARRAMSRHRRNWRAVWRQIGCHRAEDAPRLAAAAEARPAAGVARRRPVALGRLRGRRPCADRRGAPPGRHATASPTSRPNCRPRAHDVEARREAVAQAQAEVAAAAEAETAARNRWREPQREAAMRRATVTPRPSARSAAHRARRRRSARPRRGSAPAATRPPPRAAKRSSALAALPPTAELEAAARRRSASEIEGHRATRRRGARRSAGARARGRAGRPAAGHASARERESWSHPQGRRRHADRRPCRCAARGGEDRARRAWKMRRGCSPKSAPR